MRVWKRWLAWLLVLGMGAAAQAAQVGSAFDPVKGVAISLDRGRLTLKVPEGVHLKTAFLKVALKSGPGSLSLGKLPKPTAKDELGDPVWQGTVRIPVAGAGLAGEVDLEVTYQPCTEGEGGVCFPPTKQLLKVHAKDIPVLKVEVPKGAAASAGRTAAAAPAAVPPVAPAPPAPSAPAEGGLLLALLVAFGAGLAASLTPCVYPMIPITMAIVGAKGSGRARGFLLSLSLVLGMAATYTTLGVVVAKAGGTAGAFAQKPAFLFPVAALFALFALSLFGAFEIALPQGLQNRLQGGGSRKGLGGAFTMGLVLGPLSAPCVGPVIGSVLVDIATKGQVGRGALQLFVFALGMGVLFMAVGTFSAALPKSGEWLTRFKQGMGLVVLAYAAWSIRLLVSPEINLGMWVVVSLVGAAVLGAFEPALGLVAGLRRGIACLLLVLAALLSVRLVETAAHVDLLPRGGAAAAPPKASLWMEQDLEGALARAKAEGKVVLVDIYAEWCAQCHELDEKTWPDPQIQAWIRDHAVAVRIDTYKVRPDLAAKLQIRSYPTVLLLDAEGKELRRLLGFEKPPKMLAFLQG